MKGGTMDALGWVFLGILAAIIVGTIVAVAAQLPELRRYMKIRSM